MKVLASTKQFSLRYNPKNVISPIAFRYIRMPANPIRPKIMDMYANRDRDCLWWRVSIQQLQQNKKVVRSWCARRVRLAFTNALKDRGYDNEGRRLTSELEEQEVSQDSSHSNMTGYLEIVVHTPCITEKYSSVQADMQSVIGALIEKATEKKKEKSPKTRGSQDNPNNHRTHQEENKTHT
ncbi:hypothetical protein BDV25DRAFT_155188 [Aspergillus avenaceus]|uniref:Uncharacterized protein n=1 Tax=Aspergillus avenaceus TaxID=36643 RepID=A0A5N6TV91_ASPAV|nr:hypothetical protein BDV25DRAFT_155188 [Aspergillus avenaceus]